MLEDVERHKKRAQINYTYHYDELVARGPSNAVELQQVPDIFNTHGDDVNETEGKSLERSKIVQHSTQIYRTKEENTKSTEEIEMMLGTSLRCKRNAGIKNRNLVFTCFH